jgi:hypothetical protein
LRSTLDSWFSCDAKSASAEKDYIEILEAQVLLAKCSTLNTPNEDEETCTGETVSKPRIGRMTLGWGARTFARRDLVLVAMSLARLSYEKSRLKPRPGFLFTQLQGSTT